MKRFIIINILVLIFGIAISYFLPFMIIYFGMYAIVAFIFDIFIVKLDIFYLLRKAKKELRRLYKDKKYTFLPKEVKEIIDMKYRQLKQTILLSPTEKDDAMVGFLIGLKITLDIDYLRDIKKNLPNSLHEVVLYENLDSKYNDTYRDILLQALDSSGDIFMMFNALMYKESEVYMMIISNYKRRLGVYNLIESISVYIFFIMIGILVTFIILGIIFLNFLMSNSFVVFILTSGAFFYLGMLFLTYNILQITEKRLEMTQELIITSNSEDIKLENSNLTISTNSNQQEKKVKILRRELRRAVKKYTLFNTLLFSVIVVAFVYYIRSLFNLSILIFVVSIVIVLFTIPQIYYSRFIEKLPQNLYPYFNRPKIFSIYKLNFNIFRVFNWALFFGIVALILTFIFQVEHQFEFSIIIGSIITIVLSLFFIWSARQNLKSPYIFITVKIKKNLIGLIYTGIIVFFFFFILTDYLTGLRLHLFQIEIITQYIPIDLASLPIDIPTSIFYFGIFYLIFLIFIKSPYKQGIEALKNQNIEISNDWAELNKKLIKSSELEETHAILVKYTALKKVKKINFLMDEKIIKKNPRVVDTIDLMFQNKDTSIEDTLNPQGKYDLKNLDLLEQTLKKFMPFPKYFGYFKEVKLETFANTLLQLKDNLKVKEKSNEIREDIVKDWDKMTKTPAVPFKGFDLLISTLLAIFIPMIVDYLYYIFSLMF